MVDLSWSGASSPNVDIYRHGVVVATTGNDGFYTDSLVAVAMPPIRIKCVTQAARPVQIR
jgi:hypothetical protein